MNFNKFKEDLIKMFQMIMNKMNEVKELIRKKNSKDNSPFMQNL